MFQSTLFLSLLCYPQIEIDQALGLFGDAAVCNFPADEQVEEVEGVATDGTTVKVRNITCMES